MKKILIGFIMLFFFSVSAFAQVEDVAKEVLKAYKAKDVALLKKYASGFLKMAINSSYFEDKGIQKDLKAIKNWNGKIKEVRYNEGNMFGKKILMALAYYADVSGKDEIYTVALSSLDKKKWVIVGTGLAVEKKEEFEKMSKSLVIKSTNNIKKSLNKFSLEMANGKTFDKVSFEKISESLNKLNDENFFLILKHKDDFMQVAYSDKGYSLEYSEQGIQFVARDYLNKKKSLKVFKSYYQNNFDWKQIIVWDEVSY